MTGSTPGVIFDVDAMDLQELDRFEGHPSRYVRRHAIVVRPDGSEVRAWTYVLPIDAADGRPSAEYVASIRRGYEQHGLDIRILDAALRDSTCVRVFVYGTLMRGEPNHRWLDGARLLDGAARTAPSYELHDLGDFPALALEGDSAVSGELYLVDEQGLARLDELEAHPELYSRENIRLDQGTSAVAYAMSRSLLAKHSLGVIREGDWRLRISRERG